MKQHNKLEDLLKEPKIINIGLKSFHEDNIEQNIVCAHVDWRPSAGGDKELQKILQQIL